jgi:hypothetical protein
MRQLDTEWRLVLRPMLRIHGVVLLPDGSPAAGATVNCCHTSSRYPGLAGDLAPVTADEQGTFCFDVLPDLDYRPRANLGSHWASAFVDTGRGKDEYEVTLRFPGAYSVRGLLFGADGRPVAGEVRLLSDPGHPGHDPRYQAAKTDREGRFEILLTEGGSFELVGGVEGQTAGNVRVVLDEAHPHQEAVLHLSPFLVLAGRVVDEQGESCSGVSLGCSPVVEANWLQQCRTALQGIYARGPSAADGSFRFLVPAGCSYRLGYRPAPHLYAFGPEVMPPTEDAVLVVHESDKQGFEVEGRVISVASGATVNAFRVHLVTHEKSGASDQIVAEGKDGTFLAGPLMIGQRYSLRVEAEGFPPATVGPFDATVRKEQVTVRLSASGSVVCTVLRPDGTPAVQAHVGLEHADGHHPFERAWQGETDRDGRICFDGVPPDDFTVYAQAAVVSGGAAQGTVTVRPGQQTTVQLTLKR